MTELIKNTAPLEPQYLPSEFVDRMDEKFALRAIASDTTETGAQNLHIYGPRGTGKTHFTHSLLEDNEANTCYVSCNRFNTQYKVLKQIYQKVAGEDIGSGHHVSDLQRKVEERTDAVQTVVVLDEIDFLLLNDGDSLLYFLSRIKNSENLAVITISSNRAELPLEERTKSSLQPRKINFPMYKTKQVFEILRIRARDSLIPRSVQREALTYIASTTSNINQGLHWLRTAAEHADNAVTENVVHDVEDQAYQRYVDSILDPFSTHHDLVYQAIQELSEKEKQAVVQSGEIYNRYRELCKAYGEDTLSQRRISDFLKHLELLDLVEADYHYGGKKGKTREITLKVDR